VNLINGDFISFFKVFPHLVQEPIIHGDQFGKHFIDRLVLVVGQVLKVCCAQSLVQVDVISVLVSELVHIFVSEFHCALDTRNQFGHDGELFEPE
jgi:hypothetical protein